jgi:hypothetical protein
MPGSTVRLTRTPRPLELAARLLIAALVAFWLMSRLTDPLVRGFLPAIRTAIWVLSDDFVVTSAEIVRTADTQTVRFRANLTRPIRREGYTIYPFGWQGRPLGGFEVKVSLFGVLQYETLLLTLVLAWPVRRMAEVPARLAVCLPLIAVMILIDVPSTVLAELRSGLQEPTSVATDGWMLWSRFLMGGGGLILGIVLAAAAIAVGARLARAMDTLRSSGASRVEPNSKLAAP